MSKLSKLNVETRLTKEQLEKLTTQRLLALLNRVRKRVSALEKELSPLEVIQDEPLELSSLKTYKQQIKEILYFREDV